LAILGVIATFTIPKILNTAGDSSTKTIFKDTFTTLSAITYQFTLESRNPADYTNYVLSKVNATKICNTDMVSQGCTTNAQRAWSWFVAGPGYVMPNGAIVDLSWNVGSSSSVQTIVFDWNGLAGSNTLGDDIFILSADVGTYKGVWNAISYIRPGQIACNNNGAGTESWLTKCQSYWP
jgi:hypothetical protein